MGCPWARCWRSGASRGTSWWAARKSPVSCAATPLSGATTRLTARVCVHCHHFCFKEIKTVKKCTPANSIPDFQCGLLCKCGSHSQTRGPRAESGRAGIGSEQHRHPRHVRVLHYLLPAGAHEQREGRTDRRTGQVCTFIHTREEEKRQPKIGC